MVNMSNAELPCQANHFYDSHIQWLLNSYQQLLGKDLLELSGDLSPGQQVFDAGFALLSHNNDSDPLFNYANRVALDLFELSWQDLIVMPSRLSAEPVERSERERLLAEVAESGFINHYSGVRIAKNGKRFLIRDAVVWNIYDCRQEYYGQAACFKDWLFLS